MIPIAPTVFWGPMAYAVMGGLVVATLLTLVFLPALYVAWLGIKPVSEPQPAILVDAPELAAAEPEGAGRQPAPPTSSRENMIAELRQMILNAASKGEDTQNLVTALEALERT